MTADDLGLSAGVTRGVLDAHRHGVVRSTSLLVTFPAAEESAALALAEPDLEVGLHLDLVGGRPASDPATVPSLCDEDGRFYPLSAFARRARYRVHEIPFALVQDHETSINFAAQAPRMMRDLIRIRVNDFLGRYG